MRFHIKSSSYYYYACTMATMPIYNYRSVWWQNAGCLFSINIASKVAQ